MCLEEHQRQQKMLQRLRDDFAADLQAMAQPPAAPVIPASAPPANPQPPAAVNTAEIPAKGPPSWANRAASKEMVIIDLRRVAKKLHKNAITTEEFLAHGRFSRSIVINRFGSWNAGLKAAGLVVRNPKFISSEELFENMEEVWKKLGRPPAESDLLKAGSRFTAHPYRDRFFTWRGAQKAFIAWAVQKGHPEGTFAFPPRRKDPTQKITPKLRWTVFERDHYKCVICGRSPATDPSVALHVDHIEPRSRGGKPVLSNLRTLCSKCNLGKGDT